MEEAEWNSIVGQAPSLTCNSDQLGVTIVIGSKNIVYWCVHVSAPPLHVTRLGELNPLLGWGRTRSKKKGGGERGLRGVILKVVMIVLRAFRESLQKKKSDEQSKLHDFAMQASISHLFLVKVAYT
jgi:hypothetical protein